MGGAKASMEEFLKQCELSGDAAYSALRSLLERLENPNTRIDARIFLSELHKRFASKEASEECLRTYHFQIQDIFLEQYEGTISISISNMHLRDCVIIRWFCLWFWLAEECVDESINGQTWLLEKGVLWDSLLDICESDSEWVLREYKYLALVKISPMLMVSIKFSATAGYWC